MLGALVLGAGDRGGGRVPLAQLQGGHRVRGARRWYCCSGRPGSSARAPTVERYRHDGSAFLPDDVAGLPGGRHLAVWGLNLQYGVAGVYNFAFDRLPGVGAYIAAVLTLGPDAGNGGFQPTSSAAASRSAPVLLAGVVAGRCRSSWGAWRCAGSAPTTRRWYAGHLGHRVARRQNVIGLFNGPAGLSLDPPASTARCRCPRWRYQWFYVGVTAATCLFVYLFVHRVTSSPLGRALRAIRDNEDAAQALGKDVVRMRLFIFVMGGAIAGISGAVLVSVHRGVVPGSWATWRRSSCSPRSSSAEPATTSG